MDYLSSNVSNDAFHAVNIQLLWPKFSHDEKNPLNGDKSVIFKKKICSAACSIISFLPYLP